MDSLKAYFGSSERISSVIRQELERAKVAGKSGVSIFGDMGSFFYRHDNGDLLDYELSLSSGFDSKLKIFCLYYERDFDARLTAAQKQKLLEHHGKKMVISDSQAANEATKVRAEHKAKKVYTKFMHV
jgi:hypothetical protein